MRRLIFWEFPRTSWQYDVVVALILGFILLTPRAIFHDQPRAAGVVQIPGSARETVFWIDPSLITSTNEEQQKAQAVALVQKKTGKRLELERLHKVADPDEEIKGFMAVFKP